MEVLEGSVVVNIVFAADVDLSVVPEVGVNLLTFQIPNLYALIMFQIPNLYSLIVFQIP